MFVLLALSSCGKKHPDSPVAAREPRAPLPRSTPAATSSSDQAADALRTAVGPDACFKAASDLAKSGTAQAVRLLIDEATSRENEPEIAAIFDSFHLLITPESLATLAELSIKGKSPAVLQAACPVLADRADGDTVDVLVTLLYDRPAPADRSHKVRLILGSIQNPAAARALGKLLLSAPEPDIIAATATALGNIHTPTARASLQQALDDRPDLSAPLRTSLQNSLEKARAVGEK